jgi:leucine-rich repeat protein SHOC2
MDLQLQIKHGSETLAISAAAACTVQQLKQQLEQLTGLFVRNQKLIFKGKVLVDASTLEACKLTTGSKVMLLQSEGLPVKVCVAHATILVSRDNGCTLA